MRKVCVVNNYNYDKYLPSCLESLIRQSVKFDIIYVVDDGSTDGSRSIIAEYAKSFQEIVPLFKDNAGQLSCFNFVYEYITEDDLVWFIDSDDYYPKDYVEQFLSQTQKSESDFYFCKTIQFSTDDMAPKTSYQETKPVVDIGLSVQITCLTKCWIGGPTSSIVVTGRLFKDVFPYPLDKHKHWRIYPDEVLVYGASLGGYSKTFLPSLGFGYRIHGSNITFTASNNDYGRISNHEYKKNRIKNRDILFSWFEDKYGLEEKIEWSNIVEEFESILPSQYRKTFSVSIHRLLKKYLIRKICSVPNMIFNK